MSQVVASILIPTASRDRDMTRAVLSALGQSIRDIEVLVIDDHSDDDTAEILDVLQKYDQRLRVIRLPLKMGISGGLQRNEGLKVSKGKYIAYLDDDDVMTPWAIEARVRVLEAREELDFCWGRTLFIRNRVPDWEHLVYERLVAQPRFDVDWSIGTIIPDEFMHRAGVVGGDSGIWWTPGRGEDQRLLAELTGRGYRGAPVDALVAVYGRGEGFTGKTIHDQARRARLRKAEKDRLEGIEVFRAGDDAPSRPVPPPARLPLTFADRLRMRNARSLQEAPHAQGVMQGQADSSSVPQMRTGDEEGVVRDTLEVEV